jgi:hypothetical protein
MTFIRPFRLNLGDGSDGSPGSLGSFTIGKSVYQWAGDITLPNGQTINTSFNHRPNIFRCAGTFTLSGVINGVGRGYPGTATQGGDRPHPGTGPGASTDSASNGGGGGGAGHATWGTGASAGRPGPPYDAFAGLLTGTFLGDMTVGSSGSSGGGAYDAEENSRSYGGGGGAGGGGIIIYCHKFVIGPDTNRIDCRGSNGGPGEQQSFTSAGGGGGSGGFVLVVAEEIEFLGSGVLIYAGGGSGGSSPDGGKYGGAGAPGRIYLCYTRSITPDAAARCNPVATVIDLSKHKTPIG